MTREIDRSQRELARQGVMGTVLCGFRKAENALIQFILGVYRRERSF
jgi:hypothetical protein